MFNVHKPRCWSTLRLGFLAATVFAGGCAAPTPWQTPYNINGVHPVAQGGGKAFNHAAMAVLLLAPVSASPWLDTDAYQYHLLYRNPQMLLYYRDARWVGTPAEMLGSRLLQRLQHSHAWKAVLSGQSGAAAQYVLQVQLTNFVVDFSTAQTGKALVAGTATLVNAHDYQVIAQQQFTDSVALSTASAAAGASAMAQASNEFVTAVTDWAARVQ
ncbi:ABC-type transport auxiliary lipoprotein family protein [Acidithiobacillus sp. M4-SHS-6]|uniref:ABC-type transport auxiliary lipoprotein family protein n=1 Tax=Acidithiobacillus sp. M4-SHS-6 TaxID=3383024 RepID=UPI0039BE55C6